ncbi:MAG TPA: hypothetical protein VNG31_00455 [Candidatus Baltobacteraceae bacterium]|nr:hypothetical protein [Candidatus Baltobacteraceae bacterium]
MLRLSSPSEALQALQQARDVEMHAYTLHGPFVAALEAAARRGAHVVVRLAEKPFADPGGYLAAENQRVAAALRAAGADAAVEEGSHAKTMRVDEALYLDDRNWQSDDVVLRADAADAASIPMRKHAALLQERSILQSTPGDDVIVETESFALRNSVSAGLDALAQSGSHPRLLVNDRDLRGNTKEAAALRRMVDQGVRVRICSDSEKLACADAQAWVGSANATAAYGPYDTIDWGVASRDPAIVDAVRTRLEARWERAREFVAPPPTHTPKSLNALRSVVATISSGPTRSTSASLAAV